MNHSGMASSSPAAGASPHNAKDVSFAQGMVMHHRQAIEMVDLLLAKQGVNSQVATLAMDIKKAQQPEIDQMNGWLKSWGEKPMTGSMSGQDMGSMSGGMMSKTDMKALEDASGATASSLFLKQMIVHHKGAVKMAQTEVSTGKNPEAVALAKKIVSDQTAQISQMEDLLTRI